MMNPRLPLDAADLVTAYAEKGDPLGRVVAYQLDVFANEALRLYAVLTGLVPLGTTQLGDDDKITALNHAKDNLAPAFTPPF